jgi:hypothetical protein
MTQCKAIEIRQWDRKRCVFLTVLFSLLCAGVVYADIETPDVVESDTDSQETTVETNRYVSVQSGYRFITPNGSSGATSPYGLLKSGVTGEFSAGTLGSDLKLTTTGRFLHENDYRTELFYDYRGLVRFHAESAALWHNLLREQVNPGTLNYLPYDQNATYGTRTAITQADTRLKLGYNPIHFNLGYWELKREGFEQLRFSDHYFGTAANTVITESSRVDRVTREGNVGFDAHAGWFNLSYGFRIRDFSNEAADPRYMFTPNVAGALTGDRHNVIPDSRVTSHTIKLFSDLSGGLVGSAFYNLTQRENTGGHGDAVPSERPSDVIHYVAGDLTYTPSKQHSFTLKYRHREIDRTIPALLYYPYAQMSPPPPGVNTTVPGELLVRPATSSVRDILTFSATLRPAPKVMYRLEYNAELEARDNVRDAQTPASSPTSLHSDSRQTHTGTAAFYWKPVGGVKLNTTYSYATCNNPAYGTSFSDRHTGKLLLTYTHAGRWGISGNYLVQYETGERSAWVIPPTNLAISTGSDSSLHGLSRKSRNNSANVSVWFSPLERLTINTSYSFLRAEIDQASLLTELSRNALAATGYDSTSHVYSIDANYAASERVDLSLAVQQVFSRASYSVPPITEFSATDSSNNTTLYSTAGISELTRLNTTETGVSVRVDWRINTLLGCSLDYHYKIYNSGNSLYDGSAHTSMVMLKARW